MINFLFNSVGISKKSSSYNTGRQIFKLMGLLMVITAAAFFFSGCELFQDPPPEVGQVDLETVLEESQAGQEHQSKLAEIGLELEEQYHQAGDGSFSETPEQQEIYERYLREKEILEDNFQSKLEAVLTELAEEKSLKTVLSDEAVYSGALDITAETVEKIDAETETSQEDRGEEYFGAGN